MSVNAPASRIMGTIAGYKTLKFTALHLHRLVARPHVEWSPNCDHDSLSKLAPGRFDTAGKRCDFCQPAMWS